LPSYRVGELDIEVNIMLTWSQQNKKGEDGTNVGDVNLTATAAGAHTTAKSATKTTTSWCTFVTAAASGRLSCKSRFGFTILIQRLVMPESLIQSDITYLSNIDESSHEVLVAESVDGLLSLLPRGIFYNARKSQYRAQHKSRLGV